MTQPAQLIDLLLQLPSSATAVNFYDERSDAGSDFFTDAATRRSNLEDHLSATWDGELLLVGEAAGWRGARQSGVAFTDAPKLGLKGTAEMSATVVHSALRSNGLAGQVTLWNTFPLHPHRPGNPRSNRAPSVGEVLSGAPALALLARNRRIVCVGQVAARAVATSLGVSVRHVSAAAPSDTAVAVRHPSFGGVRDFREQFAEAATLFGY